VPDPKHFEVGAAVLVPAGRRDIDVGDLREYCLARLAMYKIPTYFVVVDELPPNTTGKVRKAVLRTRYAELGQGATFR
jgi:acyl-CoA synthetase (AMP-forming)/AMP-acid ligase II